MLSKIKGSHCYTNNAQLQAYLESEWLNCKPVSASHLFKNSVSSNGIVIAWLPQLWSHIHRQRFHNSVDTNNFTESFNNVLKNHYLILHNDKSVFSLTKILFQCVFLFLYSVTPAFCSNGKLGRSNPSLDWVDETIKL